MSVSFAGSIRPLFRPRDLECMFPYDVLLDDYAYMSSPLGDNTYADHAHARHVYARLTGAEHPRMPLHGPYWPEANLALFQQWMDDGFQL
jgi:hypothetical protein